MTGTNFNDEFEQLKIQWGNKYANYNINLESKLSDNAKIISLITESVNLGTADNPINIENTIKINDWKTIVEQETIDLSNIIQSMRELKEQVILDTETRFKDQNILGNFEQGENVDSAINTLDNDINDWKSIYEFNLNKYNNRKQSVHGALLQAKENTEIYNYNVSAAVNMVAGVLILLYLIYILYRGPLTSGKSKKTNATSSSDSNKPKTDAKPKTDTKTDTKADTKTDTKTDAKADAKTDAKAEVKKSNVDNKSETKKTTSDEF